MVQPKAEIRTRHVRATQPSRPHDHLYDPIYTASSAKDYQKVSRKSVVSGIVRESINLRIIVNLYVQERIAVYNNLFSETGTYPSHGLRFKTNKHYPNIERVDQTSQTVVPFNGAQIVSGGERYRYFNRPLIPYMQSIPPDVLLHSVDVKNGTLNEKMGIRMGDEGQRSVTIATQTIYRESESQTDPYSPDYVIEPGQQQQSNNNELNVLRLIHLKFGNGLPVGLDEIEIIERAMQREKFENSLPPITDEESYNRRQELMEKQEIKDWKIREDEIKNMHQARLQLLIEKLQTREMMIQQKRQLAITTMREKKMRERDEMLEKIHKKRVKVLRKITLERNKNNVNNKVEKRDIIDDYTDFGSKVYAPITREGRIPEKHIELPQETLSALNKSSYEHITALESSIPSYELKICTEKPSQITPKFMASRKGQIIAAAVDKMEELLLKSKKKSRRHVIEPLPEMYKKSDVITRPRTPTIVEQHDNDAEQGALLLQRLIRGRSVQDSMCTGKEQRIELIKELLHQPHIHEINNNLQLETMAQTNNAEVVLDTLMGRVVSWTLDFLSKDLQRQREQSEWSEFVAKAQDIRRIREAEESGRRQAESIMRAKEDQYIKQIMQVHRTSARLLFEDVYDDVVRESAKQKGSIHKHKDNNDEKEENVNQIVHEFVSSILLPEAHKKRAADKVASDEAKYRHAAEQCIQDALNKVFLSNQK